MSTPVGNGAPAGRSVDDESPTDPAAGARPSETELVAAIDEAMAVLGELAIPHASLAPFCTYRVGGPASILVEADSMADLVLVRRAVAATGLPTLIVGKGSNLLVADIGFSGIAVHLGDRFSQVEIGPQADGRSETAAPEGDEALVTVVAGGAALLPVVARKTAAAGLTGFEWAVGVPGSIGGAVRMNAGGHGSDMAAGIRHVEVFDLAPDQNDGPDPTGSGDPDEPQRWSVDRLELGYRRSALRPGQIVVSAELALARGNAEVAGDEISEIVRWRREHQPGGQNAGSVFANPPGDSAGRIIDDLGLKGLRIGTAEVSTKHANFIQADPNGSADDVLAVIREVQRRVSAATGIELRVENRLVGFVERAGGLS